MKQEIFLTTTNFYERFNLDDRTSLASNWPLWGAAQLVQSPRWQRTKGTDTLSSRCLTSPMPEVKIIILRNPILKTLTIGIIIGWRSLVALWWFIINFTCGDDLDGLRNQLPRSLTPDRPTLQLWALRIQFHNSNYASSSWVLRFHFEFNLSADYSIICVDL